MNPIPTSEWNARGFENFVEDGFGLRGFALRRDITRADHHAMRKHRKNQPLEIIGQTEIAAFEKRASLCGAMQHHSSARTHSKTQLLGSARALDNFQRVIEQALIH